MKENRLINFRENYFVWLLLLYFSFVGVALLSRLFEWDEVLKVIDILKLGYPLRKLTGPYTEKIALPLSLFHFGLGLVGCVLLFYKPRLADLGIIKFEEKEHTRFNLLIISSFLSIYVFGLYNLPELIIGLRVPIFLQDTLFDYLTSVNFLISGLLFLIISIYILKDSRIHQKIGYIIFFLLLGLTCILIAGEVINWGQRLFDWDTQVQFSILKKTADTEQFGVLPRLLIIEWVAGITFSILLFEGWIGKRDSLRGRLSMIMPPWELYISAIIAFSSSGHYNPNLFEILLSIFFLMYSIWIWNTWRINVHSSKLTAEENL